MPHLFLLTFFCCFSKYLVAVPSVMIVVGVISASLEIKKLTVSSNILSVRPCSHDLCVLASLAPSLPCSLVFPKSSCLCFCLPNCCIIASNLSSCPSFPTMLSLHDTALDKGAHSSFSFLLALSTRLLGPVSSSYSSAPACSAPRVPVGLCPTPQAVTAPGDRTDHV